jgi:hypothetical protein
MINSEEDFLIVIPDEKTAVKFFIERRWPMGIKCPYCNCNKYYIIESGKRFKCGNPECYKKYSCTTKSFFQAANIPILSILFIVYKFAIGNFDSSYRLSYKINKDQKSTWEHINRLGKSFVDLKEIRAGKSNYESFLFILDKVINYEWFPTKGTEWARKKRGSVKTDPDKSDLPITPKKTSGYVGGKTENLYINIADSFDTTKNKEMKTKEITPHDYAALFGCHVSYIHRLAKNNQLDKMPKVVEIIKYSRFYLLKVKIDISEKDFELGLRSKIYY